MRKSSIYAIVGYTLTAAACVLTFFGVKSVIDGFDKKDSLQEEYRVAHGAQFAYEEEHAGEDYSNNEEYLALVSTANDLHKKVASQDSTSRLKLWTFAVPSILLPLVLFSVTTAIWTEKQKEDL